jgi:hypothetical protein
MLMLWEDVHWSDPTTRESLDLLIDRVPALRVLVLITFRPEFTPLWIGRPHVTMLTLNRLPRRQGAEMIAYVTGGKALPKDIAEQIVDRTDGVPLFIEKWHGGGKVIPCQVLTDVLRRRCLIVNVFENARVLINVLRSSCTFRRGGFSIGRG